MVSDGKEASLSEHEIIEEEEPPLWVSPQQYGLSRIIQFLTENLVDSIGREENLFFLGKQQAL